MWVCIHVHNYVSSLCMFAYLQPSWYHFILSTVQQGGPTLNSQGPERSSSVHLSEISLHAMDLKPFSPLLFGRWITGICSPQLLNKRVCFNLGVDLNCGTDPGVKTWCDSAAVNVCRELGRWRCCRRDDWYVFWIISYFLLPCCVFVFSLRLLRLLCFRRQYCRSCLSLRNL